MSLLENQIQSMTLLMGLKMVRESVPKPKDL